MPIRDLDSPKRLRTASLRFVMLLATFLLLCFSISSATNIYIAQTAQGGNTGADCPDAYAVTFFNTSSNWGSGPGQIGPGTTLHLCGTFTGAAGSTMLTVQGSGSSGSPIVVHFESGANLTAPYWSAGGYQTPAGAITCNGKNYITIDGGTNGLITTTANGDALTYQQSSSGIEAYNCSNLTIENLSIGPMFLKQTGTATTCPNDCGRGIWIQDGSNITVQNNIINDGRYAILTSYGVSTDQNWAFSSNQLYNTSGCIIIGDANTNSIINGVTINADSCHDLYMWYDSGDVYHSDGIHFWALQSGSEIENVTISNCYFYGDPGAHMSSFIFSWNNSVFSPIVNMTIYNNVIAPINNNGDDGEVATGATNLQVYNNTIVGAPQVSGSGTGLFLGGSNISVENNLVTGLYIGEDDEATSTTVWDYNEINASDTNQQAIYQGNWVTWTTWQGTYGFDTHGLGPTSAPILSSSYQPQSGSPGNGKGVNLTSLGIAGLDVDKAGNTRSPNGAWDIGAYVYGDPPNPPTGLAAVVQ